jgi:PhnB protein
MQNILCPYLNFNGNAREAMEFYHDIFDGELDLNTFGDYHMEVENPLDSSRIMHASLQTPFGTVMAADILSTMKYIPGNSFSLSVSGDDPEVLRDIWDELCLGGTITMPMEKQMWGDEFGMVTDKFGVNWMVNINSAIPAL